MLPSHTQVSRERRAIPPYTSALFIPLALIILLLVVGKFVFWRFDPRQPLWRRILKVVVTLPITAAVSRYLGTVGVIVWFKLVILIIVCNQGIWLLRHGVNGWTAKPASDYAGRKYSDARSLKRKYATTTRSTACAASCPTE